MAKEKDRSKWKETVDKYKVPKDVIEKQERYLDKLEFLQEDAAKRAEFFKDFQLPGVSYVEEADAEVADSSSEGTSEGGYLDFDYEDGWLGTIYAPTLGGINSSGDPTVTATGVKVANYRTIAVDPALIPYGSFVAIKVAGVDKLTRIWHAEDTGGAINGKHIDMCVEGDYVKNHSFKGDISVAIVKKGKNAQTARDNEKAGIDKIIAEIESSAKTVGGGGDASVNAKGVFKKACQAAIKKSKEKTEYSQAKRSQWENNIFDCSSFCNWAYQQAGVYIMGKNMGRNGNTKTIKHSSNMKTVATKDLKPGDFVFMNSYGHVGIYIGDNKWVGCGVSTKVHINQMGESWYTWNCTHRRWKG